MNVLFASMSGSHCHILCDKAECSVTFRVPRPFARDTDITQVIDTLDFLYSLRTEVNPHRVNKLFPISETGVNKCCVHRIQMFKIRTNAAILFFQNHPQFIFANTILWQCHSSAKMSLQYCDNIRLNQNV